MPNKKIENSPSILQESEETLPPSNRKASEVPSSRFARVAKLSGLAGGIAGRAIASGAGQLLKAQRPTFRSSLLSLKNASAISERLSEMRGAAMKVGQMLSMDAGEFLPPEWEPILAGLRQGADPMPKSQLLQTLTEQWGPQWADKFSYFSFEPIASASIGQVHKAQLKSGELLAVKVQYPGVSQSIDSDIGNVGRLIKLSGMIPKHFDLDAILQQASEQLKHEADYQQEAAYLAQYQHLLNEHALTEAFTVPSVYQDLSNEKILCMDFVAGKPIDDLAKSASQALKGEVMTQLFRLMLKELFSFGFLQSDPNFANYLFDASSKQIMLLDFGACRNIDPLVQSHYKMLAVAMLEQDQVNMEKAMRALSLIHDNMDPDVVKAILNGCLIASECLQSNSINFKQSQLIKRIFEATKIIMEQRKDMASPNFDVALINRKVSGMVMLANKMDCDIALRGLVLDALKDKSMLSSHA